MKILRKGDRWPWAGKQVVCKQCGTLLELETEDNVYKGINNSFTYSCAECGAANTWAPMEDFS